ncbi:MAG: hypothetical protein AAB602_00025 [Patescibacteria group bacterium]
MSLKKRPNSAKGDIIVFSPKIVLVVVGVALVAGTGYFMYRERIDAQPIASNKAVEEVVESAVATTWKTYHNEKYGFELKYPPDFQIETSPVSKMTGLGICVEARCEKFLAIYEKPLPLADPTYQDNRKTELLGNLSGIFYYYAIKTDISITDKILSTFKFIK